MEYQEFYIKTYNGLVDCENLSELEAYFELEILANKKKFSINHLHFLSGVYRLLQELLITPEERILQEAKEIIGE